MRKFNILMAVAVILSFASCNNDDPSLPGDSPEIGEIPGEPGGNGNNDGNAPDFNTTIQAYQGQKATDADKDNVGTDEDIYYLPI